MNRIVIWAVSAVVAIPLLGVAVFNVIYPRQQPPSGIQVAVTEDKIAHGQYLVVNVLQCVDCHSERDWTIYGGPPVEPIGAGRACITRDSIPSGVNAGEGSFPGILCIRNITPDKETGIGAWSDGEIIRAVREGVTRDGKGLFPIMPYFIYRNLADDDMEAIVAYLRSMDPDDSIRPQREIALPMGLMVHLWPAPVKEPVIRPDKSDTVAYGEYLSVVARCKFCHSPREPNAMDPFAGREYSGGMPFFMQGQVLYPMNLTPHEDGLGGWAKQDFIDLFRMYNDPIDVTPDANTVMNWLAFSAMTDEDLGALFDFFQSLEPVETILEPL